MEPPKFYRKYTSGSDSEESESYISDTDSDYSSRQSQVSFTNNVPNFADLARNLLRRDIGGESLNSLSTIC